MSSQPEETPEIRRNKILADAIGLTHWEVAEYVVSIQRKDDSGEYTVYFGIQTPKSVLDKVVGITGGLFVHTKPIDFQGLQTTSI
jgi:hypothetical protein